MPQNKKNNVFLAKLIITKKTFKIEMIARILKIVKKKSGKYCFKYELTNFLFFRNFSGPHYVLFSGTESILSHLEVHFYGFSAKIMF